MQSDVKSGLGGPMRKGLLAIMGVIAVFGVVFLRDYASLAQVAEILQHWQAVQAKYPLMTFIGFVLLYAVIVTFSLPGALVLSLSGGVLFGLYLGGLANFIAAWSGAVIAFLMVRWGAHALHNGGDDGAHSQRFSNIKNALEHNQITVLFMLRLIPVVPFFLANVLPALWGVRLRPYAVTTGLGIIPGCIVYTAAGDAAKEALLLGAAGSASDLITPQAIWALFGLAALAVLPAVLAPLRRRLGV